MTIEDLEEIDELQIDEEEFEPILKRFKEDYQEPVVHIGPSIMYFNSKAGHIVPKYTKWVTTNEYVIGLPTTRDDKNGYVAKGMGFATTMHTPVMLRDNKKLKPGYYKVYKYKDGFAFKRYEQINNDA